MHERWITVGEVAARLHISRPTARRKLQKGEIPGLVAHLGYSRVERKVFEKWAVSQDLGKK